MTNWPTITALLGPLEAACRAQNAIQAQAIAQEIAARAKFVRWMPQDASEAHGASAETVRNGA